MAAYKFQTIKHKKGASPLISDRAARKAFQEDIKDVEEKIKAAYAVESKNRSNNPYAAKQARLQAEAFEQEKRDMQDMFIGHQTSLYEAYLKDPGYLDGVRKQKVEKMIESAEARNAVYDADLAVAELIQEEQEVSKIYEVAQWRINGRKISTSGLGLPWGGRIQGGSIRELTAHWAEAANKKYNSSASVMGKIDTKIFLKRN